MNNHQQSHHHQQQQNQRSDWQPQFRQQQSGNPQEQRREFLWRERVKLELQVQALSSYAESLERAWHVLQQRKASRQQQKPKLAMLIVFSSLARMPYLPAERLFHHERERLMQEEDRLRQAMIFCQGDLAGLQAQIKVIQLELSFLP